ncbi:11257_t:CDS:2 [Ambispora gerdemannii]|uniref:11257_t:CDS:1 n=1 Tax=Ambispora gerdemannii TaxID=144530 RepID=A0A9N9GEQ3_9GLOM|nr:11257_t:CDS:2 [Ambispora gerdemannii]
MVANNYNEESIDAYDVRRSRESRVKLAILIIIGVLIAGFATWNIWRMVEAIQSPVVSVRNANRAEIPGEPCNEYLTNARYDGTNFVNMKGFYNLTGQFCYIFDPQKPANDSSGPPLKYNNATQKIALALYSSKKANNTLGAITNDEWYFFGVFTEREDPTKVRFQIVKMPAISYLYFKRTEIKQNINLDAITGGGTGDTAYDPTADVQLDTSFTSFEISGFGIGPTLWCIFRIIPQNYKTDPKTDTQIYPIQMWFRRVEFTLLQLTANMGGFVSILSAIYFILLGSRRVDPWGVVQRYVIPPAYTPTVFPYTDTKHHPQDDPSSNTPHTQAETLYGNLSETQNSQRFGGTSTSSSVYQPSEVGVVPGMYLPQDDYNDPQIQRLRNELRAEIQGIIAQEIGKLRVYLSKYYFRDLAPEESP